MIYYRPRSGTRILLDTVLKEKGLTRQSIRGYDREESSHTAVGILVRSQEFKRRLDEIGGHNTEDTGKVKYVHG